MTLNMTGPNELIRLYWDSILILSKRLAAQWSRDREDIQQELVLILLEQGEHYQPHLGPINLWLKWRWRNLHRRHYRPREQAYEDISHLSNCENEPVECLILKEEISNCLLGIETLSAREKDVIIKHYGLAGHHPYTLTMLAAVYNVSPQWISRIRQFALSRLRESPIPSTHRDRCESRSF